MYIYKKICHALNWRWSIAFRNIEDSFASISATAETEWRWHIKKRSRAHGLAAPLIVSLTSYPLRYHTLGRTLKNLLRQSIAADRIILWIAPEDMPNLPRFVLRLRAHGIDIRAAENTQSYKKILPALDAFPDAFICTADDDAYYWATWLEELVDGMDPSHTTIACHRAHEITLTESGHLRPYDAWKFDTRFRGVSERLFPTGALGVLYPPGALLHEASVRRDALELCPHADDVWLFWVGRRNGMRYRTVGVHRKIINWKGSQRAALWHGNYSGGGNDVQIHNMIAKYGFP